MRARELKIGFIPFAGGMTQDVGEILQSSRPMTASTFVVLASSNTTARPLFTDGPFVVGGMHNSDDDGAGKFDYL
jgi:hypothetical protein